MKYRVFSSQGLRELKETRKVIKKSAADFLTLKKLIYISTLFLLIAYPFSFWGIHYNISESVPLGFYLRITAPIQKGSFVEICPPVREPFLTAYDRNYIGIGSCPHQMRYLLKKVVALNGDTISMTNRGLVINGRKYLDSKPFKEDQNHRPLSRWRIENYKLKENEVLLMGENPASYDGRYFGLLKLSDVISVMKPISILK